MARLAPSTTGRGCRAVYGNRPTGRIRACHGSSLAAKFEVLVSPARPLTMIAANESLPTQGAGFLSRCHDKHISCGTLCRRRLAAQPANVLYIYNMPLLRRRRLTAQPCEQPALRIQQNHSLRKRRGAQPATICKIIDYGIASTRQRMVAVMPAPRQQHESGQTR